MSKKTPLNQKLGSNLKFRARLSRAIGTRPDRRAPLRLRTLRTVRLPAVRFKGGRPARGSLKILGSSGRVCAIGPSNLLRIFTERKRVLLRKYRLRLANLTPQCVLFAPKTLPLYRLRKHRATAAQRRTRAVRQRAFTSADLAVHRKILQLRTVHSASVPPAPRYWKNKWYSKWVSRYQRRAARRGKVREGRLKYQEATLPSRAFRHLVAFKYRLTRIDFEGVNLPYRKYWWWSKKLRREQKRKRRLLKTRGVKATPADRVLPSKYVIRRRHRGKRLFAGMFGPRRWRAERRDRFFVRRERGQTSVSREMVYRSARTAINKRHFDNQQQYKLRLLTSSLAVVGNPALLSQGKGTYFAHRRVVLQKIRTFPRKARRRNFVHEKLRGLARTTAQGQGFPRLYNAGVSTVTVSTTSKRLPVAVKAADGVFISTRRRTALQSNKLSVQRRLLAAVLTVTGQNKPTVSMKTVPTQMLHTHFLRSSVSRSAPIKAQTTKPAAQRAKLPLRSSLTRGAKRMHGIRGTTFLTQKPANFAQPQAGGIRPTAGFLNHRAREGEVRFYHRRPQLRLPYTDIVRYRRRKAGLVTFIRNSLKQPRTLRGQQNLLLPPVAAYIASKSGYLCGATPNSRKRFALAARREDEWPVFWRRPHNRANITAIASVRRWQYSQRKRRYMSRQGRWNSQRIVPLKTYARPPTMLSVLFKHNSPTLADQKAKLQCALTRRFYPRLDWTPAVEPKVRLAVRFERKSRRKKAIRIYRKQKNMLIARRTPRRSTPTTSRISGRNLLGPCQRAPNAAQLLGLWQARSVGKMLSAERKMSAWSPQLSVRNRRAHAPRVRGVPVRRRTLSFTAKRVRRNFNAKLLARNIPQRRYTDYTPIKLQYYYGSVGSTGYVRFRRVHRAHSKHSRWWRPNKYAVPFAHPFTRRALNAKRYLRSDFSSMLTPKRNSFTHLMKEKRAVFLHSKLPARPIPWRNFRFKRPRWGRTPKLLKRWTFVKRHGLTGRIRPSSSRFILQRTPRELRALEQYTFNRGVWKTRRWGLVDRAFLAGNIEGHLFSSLRSVPQTVWRALQERAGSAAAYAALQQYILAEFRRWVRKEGRLSSRSLIGGGHAELFLINLLAATLHQDPTRITAVVQEAQRHSTLRKNSFNKKVSLKAVNFLQLRVLPKLDRAPDAESILKRERSGLYRRWLRGVEGAAKRLQVDYVPTSRSRYTANVAIAFGRQRARFPASGRRLKSYDALLHAFTKKTAPARFRRAAVTKFTRVLPPATFDFRENLLSAGTYAGLNRRRSLSCQLASASYLSAPWRELLQLNPVASTSTQPNQFIAKRRFLALPIKAIADKREQHTLRAASPYKQQMRVIRTGILRCALRRRREERSFIDLRHSALQRRLPKEQATRPWKLRRARKRWQAAKMGPYSSFTVQRTAATPGRWSLVHLSAVGPQYEYLKLSSLPAVLGTGERVESLAAILRKDRRAFRGFVLPVNAPKRKKLRRKVRGTSNRSRISRRPNPAGRYAVIRNMSHWSEKKDEDFRTLNMRHKRISYAKRTFRVLSRRSGLGYVRSRFPLKQWKNVRKLCFGRLKAFKHFNKMSEPQSALFKEQRARALVAKTSLVHPRRLIQSSRANKLAYLRQRGYRAPRLRRRKFRISAAKFNFQARQDKVSVSERLLRTVGAELPTPTLWFQKPATRIVKSEKAKENDALADIAQKEGRYKITAQYVDSLTSFIPELMNQLLSRRIEKKASQIHYITAQHLVRNIYWSLRVYLNVDPFDTRFFARDKMPAARVRLFEQISDMSEFQLTGQVQRAVLRYRFQPSKLLRAPNTMRFRGDWLRAFFPAKHALYQENPEDYRKFLFKTRRIRSLRIGSRGIASWATEKQRIGHETRARQILTLRLSRKRRRFETVLQTTRRIPASEGTHASAGGTSREHFFSRQFSTYAGRGLAATSRWIHRQKRFIALADGWRAVAPAAQFAARSRTLLHLESRGKTGYIATERAAISNTFLDTRFIRAKSPRSRQYLLRASRVLRGVDKKSRFKNLVFYREQLSRRLQVTARINRHWTRASRRTFAISLRANWAAVDRTPLRKVRNVYPILRARTLRPDRRVSCTVKLRSSKLRTHALTRAAPAVLAPEAVYSLRPLQRWRKKEKDVNTMTRSIRKEVVIPFTKNKFSLRQKLRRSPRFNAAAVALRLADVKRRQGRLRFFKKRVSRGIFRALDFARACAMYTRFRRQAPFEAHRPRLWDALTLRWMKKHRIGRYWLRDTSRWLRDPWLSQIVACDAALRPDRFGGELRARQQQVGEYVPDVDAYGRDIKRKNAPKERHKFQRILPKVADPEIKKTNKILKKGSRLDRSLVRQRLRISRQATRKPVPGIRLANYEFRDVIREHKENKAKSVKQKREEEEQLVKDYWARKAKNLPPLRPKRLPLKHPANLWLPHVIWKEIQRRIRKFEWRESDEVFFRRGFRRAFQFHPNERRKAPWLEHLMYTRATYSTHLREFRRRQYPHEQKKFKWLQRVRRMLYPGRNAWYIKGRRWPQLRRYNQKLHYSLFNFRDRAAARRHFKKLNGRTRPSISAFVAMSRGLTDRLDLICLQMGFAPSIYWARIVAEFGLIRVNGKTVYDPTYRLRAADIIYPNWDAIARFQHYFRPHLRAREEYLRRNRASTAFYPTNMEYHRGLRAFIYKHAPDEFDLRKSSRLFAPYLRWFKLDSV